MLEKKTREILKSNTIYKQNQKNYVKLIRTLHCQFFFVFLDHRGMVDNEDKPVKEGGSIAATTAGRHCRRSTTSRSPVQLFCISLKFRQGYGTAFSWLAQFLE